MHNNSYVGEDLAKHFGQYWRQQISDVSPPDVQVVVIGLPNGDSPIHDRWWISDGTGLRMGTSANSAGVGKVSEVSVLTPIEAAEREARMDEYINRTKRDHLGLRLTWQSFTL